MKISNDVSNVLANSTIKEDKLYLPQGQLDRTLYMSVDKVLKAIGGKWNRGAKAHIFDKDIASIIEEVVLTGEYVDEKKEYQVFETPTALAEKLVRLAGIKDGETVLEPSAGTGRIASFMPGCDCVELNEANHLILLDVGFTVVGRDFLKIESRYDVIVANPPFTKQQDVDHINHMLDLADRRVVSVASSSVMFRDNKKTVDFRNRIEAMGGTITALPEGSFKESGTNVNTCIVEVDI